MVPRNGAGGCVLTMIAQPRVECLGFGAPESQQNRFEAGSDDNDKPETVSRRGVQISGIHITEVIPSDSVSSSEKIFEHSNGVHKEK
ncbi:uncharacterized protein K444DRAFT_281772 [Hyaloscypha bicolor E]|uniref:Uncharacterized protein n=1 Tax=Hyaloscypha bicolor E TaxID=1095630 RepID=A0A2J6SFZ9_9HELO|nr:uncharacterized protein K444DRAFT_281772 [Hyaloscypha bicolor E]PMD49698.1 hypothetical protein K444DRAFT_281772 [Hyaloscypha bicolor E]